MSSYGSLSVSGQILISDALYKNLYGYPDTRVLLSFDQEVAGNVAPTIVPKQIAMQYIPNSAPTDLVNTLIAGKQVSEKYPYVVKYTNLLLSSKTLSPTFTYRYYECDNIAASQQYSANLLTQAIPPNYASDNTYQPYITIINNNGGSGNYSIGNAQYPFTFNPTTGIIMFTASDITMRPKATTQGDPTSTSSNQDIVKITYWRYEGIYMNEVVDVSANKSVTISGNTIINGDLTVTGTINGSSGGGGGGGGVISISNTWQSKAFTFTTITTSPSTIYTILGTNFAPDFRYVKIYNNNDDNLLTVSLPPSLPRVIQTGLNITGIKVKVTRAYDNDLNMGKSGDVAVTILYNLV